MKLIYRIENADHEGPYQTTNKKVDDYTWQRCSATRHALPYKDVKLYKKWEKLVHAMEHKSWYFGFASIEQLKYWFHTKRDRNLFHREGFYVSVYKVTNKKFHAGDTQAIFMRDGNEILVEKIQVNKI